MIDLHDALDEVRLHMDGAPAGSAVRVKLMKSAAALIDAMTAQAQDFQDGTRARSEPPTTAPFRHEIVRRLQTTRTAFPHVPDKDDSPSAQAALLRPQVEIWP